jgi:hypothetical protein
VMSSMKFSRLSREVRGTANLPPGSGKMQSFSSVRCFFHCNQGVGFVLCDIEVSH